jgi:hypothetical protein
MVSLKGYFKNIDDDFGSTTDRLEEIAQSPKYFPLDWRIYGEDMGWSKLSQPIQTFDDGIEYFLGWDISASDDNEIQSGKNALGVFALFLSESHMMVRYCTLIKPTETEIEKYEDEFLIDDRCSVRESSSAIMDSLTKGGKSRKGFEDQDREREE